jgi:hypothetical protein
MSVPTFWAMFALYTAVMMWRPGAAALLAVSGFAGIAACQVLLGDADSAFRSVGCALFYGIAPLACLQTCKGPRTTKA